MSKVLIIEDEVSIAELEKDYLELSGFDVEIESDGARGLEKALASDFDMYILDLMLPGMDGFEICKRIREVKNTPILMVSAKKDDIDKIRGLGLGADDYISKPFGVMELISRVKALLRRTEKEDDGDTLACGSIEIDNKRHSVTVQGETCELTFKEFELLKYLMINQGIVLSRDKLMNQVWGFEYEGESRTVDMHIKTLRHKLGDGGQQIKTVRNVGYVMEP